MEVKTESKHQVTHRVGNPQGTHGLVGMVDGKLTGLTLYQGSRQIVTSTNRYNVEVIIDVLQTMLDLAEEGA